MAHIWTIDIMTQPRPDKILSALVLNKACTVLFLRRPYNPKRILSIKTWITPYKPNISPVLCQCGSRLWCYIHPLRDSAFLLRFYPPSLKRTHGAALISSVVIQPNLTLIPYVMTKPRLGKILFALDLNQTRMILFLGCLYTPKYILPINAWITPYKSTSLSCFANVRFA